MGSNHGLLFRFRQDRRGAVALILAAATPVLVGGLGLSVDTIQWTLTKRQMQRQADSGAIAGAYGLAQGRSVAAVVADDLARNASVPLSRTVIENAPSAGPEAGNTRAVRVALATSMNLPFTGFLLGGPVTIPAEATAAMVANGEFCALSLEPGAVAGITMTGNTTVNLGCGMATNSVAAVAVEAGGSSRITASPVAAVGGVPPSSNYDSGTQLIPFSVPQPDPFASLPNPSGFTAPQNGRVNSNQTRTLNPGTYRGMNLDGTVTMNPGVYLVDGGDFSVGAQARITGSGVTIIITSQTAASNPNSIGQVRINGGAELKLTAPSSGTYAGVLFYQDRRAANSNQPNRLNGNSASRLMGALYFPAQELEFTGTTGMDIDCLQMVGRRLSFTGNSRIRNICPASSGAKAFTGTAVRLVG